MEITPDGDRIPDSVAWRTDHSYRIFDPTLHGPHAIAAEALPA